MKKILVLLILISFVSFSQEKIKIYTFNKVEKLQQESPKPIFVFISTNWCAICFGMKQTTFKNRQVINLLNRHFYLVDLDAENEKDINFLGKTYRYKSSGNKTGIHELAATLATKNKQVVYPTSTILNKKFEIDLQIQGHLTSSKMISILQKYQEINHKN